MNDGEATGRSQWLLLKDISMLTCASVKRERSLLKVKQPAAEKTLRGNQPGRIHSYKSLIFTTTAAKCTNLRTDSYSHLIQVVIIFFCAR